MISVYWFGPIGGCWLHVLVQFISLLQVASHLLLLVCEVVQTVLYRLQVVLLSMQPCPQYNSGSAAAVIFCCLDCRSFLALLMALSFVIASPLPVILRSPLRLNSPVADPHAGDPAPTTVACIRLLDDWLDRAIIIMTTVASKRVVIMTVVNGVDRLFIIKAIIIIFIILA